MQHTAAIAGGVGVAGRLQGQRWAGTGAGGSSEGVGVETQLQHFFLGRSAGALLIHPSGSERNGGKTGRSKT